MSVAVSVHTMVKYDGGRPAGLLYGYDCPALGIYACVWFIV